jgi:hypothetical protein
MKVLSSIDRSEKYAQYKIALFLKKGEKAWEAFVIAAPVHAFPQTPEEPQRIAHGDNYNHAVDLVERITKELKTL